MLVARVSCKYAQVWPSRSRRFNSAAPLEPEDVAPIALFLASPELGCNEAGEQKFTRRSCHNDEGDSVSRLSDATRAYRKLPSVAPRPHQSGRKRLHRSTCRCSNTGWGRSSDSQVAHYRWDGRPIHTPHNHRRAFAKKSFPDCTGRSGFYVVWYAVWAEPVRRLRLQGVCSRSKKSEQPQWSVHQLPLQRSR